MYAVYNSIIWCYVSCQWYIIFCFTLYVVLSRNYYAIMTILLSTLCTAALHINNAIVIHYALFKLHSSAYIFFLIVWKCILYHNVPYFLPMFYLFFKVYHIPLQCGNISIMCSLLHHVSLLSCVFLRFDNQFIIFWVVASLKRERKKKNVSIHNVT